MTEKKTLYFVIAFLQSFMAATWMQALYNDPSMLKTRDESEWMVIFSLTMLNALLAGTIALKAYGSDPNGKKPAETTKP